MNNLPNEILVLILEKISFENLDCLYLNNININRLIKYANIGLIVSEYNQEKCLANYIGIYKLIFYKCSFEEYELDKFLNIIEFRGENNCGGDKYKIGIKECEKITSKISSKRSIYYTIYYMYKNDSLKFNSLAFNSPSNVLNIPLPFWYNRDDEIALPEIALQYNETRINFNMGDWPDLLQVVEPRAYLDIVFASGPLDSYNPE
jgi:hypothetical protein